MTYRLFVDQNLDLGTVTLGKDQSHYIANVMRAKDGEDCLLFNGRQGEFQGQITRAAKNGTEILLTRQTRAQSVEPDLWLVAAPIKKDRIDMVAEKATELGASRLVPVITRRTQNARVNTERLQAHMIEAAEQCERLSIPQVADPIDLPKLLGNWDETRTLVYLDESGQGEPLAQALTQITGPIAILVGPEGGFDPEERALLGRFQFTRAVGLGPRILRAETAAIAALSIIQALKGDWNMAPRSA